MIELTGDNAVAHVAGACMGDGDFHHDDTVFITHDALNCESRQVFKKVLRNGATGVFQGKILVKQGAQKTDGYQISQSLLLDDDSQFLAKPELEIYADDVACSHGSTSGAIDEEGLFYLRSRGIEEGPATDLLTIAFLAEAVMEIEDESLQDENQRACRSMADTAPRLRGPCRDIAISSPPIAGRAGWCAAWRKRAQREDRALAILMGACAILFIARWPALAREAHLAGSSLNMLLGRHAVRTLAFIAPLMFYALALVAHGVARALGGQGSLQCAVVAFLGASGLGAARAAERACRGLHRPGYRG